MLFQGLIVEQYASRLETTNSLLCIQEQAIKSLKNFNPILHRLFDGCFYMGGRHKVPAAYNFLTNQSIKMIFGTIVGGCKTINLMGFN